MDSDRDPGKRQYCKRNHDMEELGYRIMKGKYRSCLECERISTDRKRPFYIQQYEYRDGKVIGRKAKRAVD